MTVHVSLIQKQKKKSRHKEVSEPDSALDGMDVKNLYKLIEQQSHTITLPQP